MPQLAPPPKVGQVLAPPPPTNPASKDLRVLLTLRHKTKTISKGKVTVNALEDAMRVRGEQATALQSAAVGIAQARYGAGKQKAPHLEFSIEELKQEVGMSADVEAWRRAAQHGIESLVGPAVKARRLSHMSTEAGTQLLDSLEQNDEGRRKSVSKQTGPDPQPDRAIPWTSEYPAWLNKNAVQAAFSSQDEKESGFLKFAQVHNGLHALGFDLSVDEVQACMQDLGIRPSSSVDPQEFVALVGVVQEVKPAVANKAVPPNNPQPRRRGQKDSSSSDGGGSSSSTSGSSYTDRGWSSSDGEYSVDSRGTWSTSSSRLDRGQLRSPRATNAHADEVLQGRLKAMEQELQVKIDKDKSERETRFRRDLQRGKIHYIAPERYMPEQRGLYSGPVNSRGTPEGVGCFDYKKFVEQRGHVVAERRVYYAGVVVEGLRQGLGLLRWLDQTEYCGSWEGDVPHGAGLETYTDGSWYAGGIDDDKRHGMGGVWTSKGMVYLGQWNRGVRHGIGVIGHTDVVQVDKKGKGELQDVAVTIDMTNMKLNHLFPPLSNRRGEMREDVMRSVFQKRYHLDATQKVVPYFIVEYDRGVQTRSIWFSDANEHHSQLLRDAMHATRTSQVIALEALDHAKEGLRVRRQAMQANAIRRRRERQRIHRAGGGKAPRQGSERAETETPHATVQAMPEFHASEDGLRVDSLAVTVLGAAELQSQDDSQGLDTREVFVVVALDDDSYQTQKVVVSDHVVWDETFSFPVTSSWSDLVCSVYRTRPVSDKTDRTEVLLLRVTVVEARGLKAMDAGGSSDPYAVVRVGDQQVFTEVVKKTLDPVWDATFELEVEDASQTVEISVWDKDLLGADDLIGKVELILDGRAGRPAGQEWHDLLDGLHRNGQIFVSLQLPEWTDWSRGDFLGEVRVPVHSVDPHAVGTVVEFELQSLRPDRERLQLRRRELCNSLLNWTWIMKKGVRYTAHVLRVFLVQWQMIVRGVRLRRTTSMRHELQDGLRKVSHDSILNLATALQGTLQLKIEAKSTLDSSGRHDDAATIEQKTVEAAVCKDDGIGLLRVKAVCAQRLPAILRPSKVMCKLALGSESVTTSARDCFPSLSWGDEFTLPLHAGAANLHVQLFQEPSSDAPDAEAEELSLGQLSVGTEKLVVGEPVSAWYPILHPQTRDLRLLVRVVETRGVVKPEGSIFARVQVGTASCSTSVCTREDYHENIPVPYGFMAKRLDDTIRVSLWKSIADGDPVFVGECSLTVNDVVHNSRPDVAYDRWFELQERVCEEPEVVAGHVRLLVSFDPSPPPREGEIKLELELLKAKDAVTERPPRPAAKLIARGGLVQVTVHEASSLRDVPNLAGVCCDLRVSKHSTRTKVLDNVQDAVWDHTFLMDTPLNPQILRASVIGRLWLVRLQVIKAANLKAMDVGGTSDPYVIVKVGQTERKTAVIKRNLNPMWNESFELVIPDIAEGLKLSVLDKDLIGADDLIGKASVVLQGRAGQGPHEEWLDLVDDEDEKNGAVFVGIDVIPSRPQDASYGGEKSLGYVDIDLQELPLGAKSCHLHPLYMGDTHYTLSVSVLEGNGLMPVDAVASDPYVVVSIESQTFSTPVVKQECDPVWEGARFTFRVSSLDSLLTCDVYDYNAVQSHVFMGRFSMSAADIAQGDAHEQSCPLKLKPDQRDAVQRRVRAGESLGSLKLSYKLVESRVPSCSLRLCILSLQPPQFSRAHRNTRLIAYRAARGVGTLELTVVGARALSGFGHHGTYCEVSVGDEVTKSKEVKGGQTPTWDEAHSYSVAPGTTSAKVRVLCKGKGRKVLLLGEAILLLSDLQNAGEVDMWNRLDSRYKLGRLVVRVQCASGLAAADLSGTSDPFAQVSVGKRKKVTRVKKKTLDPVWEEEMLFDVWSILDVITIEVSDWDRVSNNDLLGMVELPMERVLRMCKDGERLGEGHVDAGLVLPLTGINGTPWVDADRFQRATGTVSVEVEFRGDHGLRRKVGWLRTVANYVSPALSHAQAADMDMALVDARQADEDDALGGDMALEELEQQIQDAIHKKGHATQLSRKMIARPGLNPNSLQAQIDLFAEHGGNVLGPYTADAKPAAKDPASPRLAKRRSRRQTDAAGAKFDTFQ